MSGPPGGVDARGASRAAIERPVNIEVDTAFAYRPGITANISATGMFVRSVKPAPVGALVRFELELEPGEAPVRGMGEVVWIWVPRQRPGEAAGMGIRFRYLDEAAQAALDRMIAVALRSGEAASEARQRFQPVAPQPPPRAPLPPARERLEETAAADPGPSSLGERLTSFGRRLESLLPRAKPPEPRPAAAPARSARAAKTEGEAPPKITGRQLAILAVLLVILLILLARL